MSERKTQVQVSVIVPVGQRHADMAELFAEYKKGIAATGLSYEMIFVLDGPWPQAFEALQKLQAAGERLTIIRLTRMFGEATALMAGFEHSSGQVIVTLPAYFQIEPVGIGKLLAALETADMAISRRWPRVGGWAERVRRNMFHRLVGSITGLRYQDLGCNARALRRRILEEIMLYGDQYRFLPILADRQGFRVSEIDVPQSPQDRYDEGYRVREYAHRILDIFTVFFLVRFTKKPLRFFGMAGVTAFVIGALLVAYLSIERLVFGQALADRPALLLSSLIVVLGVQLFALGLLGELIIFTHARNIKDYQIDRVIQFPVNGTDQTHESVPRRAASS